MAKKQTGAHGPVYDGRPAVVALDNLRNEVSSLTDSHYRDVALRKIEAMRQWVTTAAAQEK